MADDGVAGTTRAHNHHRAEHGKTTAAGRERHPPEGGLGGRWPPEDYCLGTRGRAETVAGTATRRQTPACPHRVANNMPPLRGGTT